MKFAIRSFVVTLLLIRLIRCSLLTLVCRCRTSTRYRYHVRFHDLFIDFRLHSLFTPAPRLRLRIPLRFPSLHLLRFTTCLPHTPILPVPTTATRCYRTFYAIRCYLFYRFNLLLRVHFPFGFVPVTFPRSPRCHFTFTLDVVGFGDAFLTTAVHSRSCVLFCG